MLCPLKFGYYEFEGGQDCIGAECGMHNLCNAETEITAVEFDALDAHAQALERENAELRKLCGANDALDDENDVSEASVDANDSRERLEADVLKWCKIVHLDGFLQDMAIGWLNRQAAITRRETVKRQEVFCDTCESVTDEHANELQKRCDELQAKVDELTAENAKLSSDELHLRQALASAEYDNATLREKLGRMLDCSHEITRIGGDC